MTSFALTKVIILIILIIITNNKKLSKLFNFEDISNKNIKYKTIFYLSMIFLYKFKKILFIFFVIYLLFNVYHSYICLTTYKIIRIKPLLIKLNNPFYLISLISFLSTYFLLSNKNNKKILFWTLIKIIPNLLLSISTLLFKINIFLTNIIYNKQSIHQIKKSIYELIHIYYKIYYTTNFYGMKNVKKEILTNIKEVKINTNNNLEFLKFSSLNKKGDLLFHPAHAWYIDNYMYINTITHKPISTKLEPFKINKESYSESLFIKITDIQKLNEQYEKKLFNNLNINDIEKYNEYKKNLLEYNDYVFKSNKEILNQTSDKKYIKIEEMLEKTSINNINKPLTIDLLTQKNYEEIIKKDKDLFNYYNNLKDNDKILFLLNLKELAINTP